MEVDVFSMQNEDILPEYRLLVSDANDVLSEIRPWQQETTFTVSESEIPAGGYLRIEARQAGADTVDAYRRKLSVFEEESDGAYDASGSDDELSETGN